MPRAHRAAPSQISIATHLRASSAPTPAAAPDGAREQRLDRSRRRSRRTRPRRRSCSDRRRRDVDVRARHFAVGQERVERAPAARGASAMQVSIRSSVCAIAARATRRCPARASRTARRTARAPRCARELRRRRVASKPTCCSARHARRQTASKFAASQPSAAGRLRGVLERRRRSVGTSRAGTCGSSASCEARGARSAGSRNEPSATSASSRSLASCAVRRSRRGASNSFGAPCRAAGAGRALRSTMRRASRRDARCGASSQRCASCMRLARERGIAAARPRRTARPSGASAALPGTRPCAAASRARARDRRSDGGCTPRIAGRWQASTIASGTMSASVVGAQRDARRRDVPPGARRAAARPVADRAGRARSVDVAEQGRVVVGGRARAPPSAARRTTRARAAAGSSRCPSRFATTHCGHARARQRHRLRRVAHERAGLRVAFARRRSRSRRGTPSARRPPPDRACRRRSRCWASLSDGVARAIERDVEQRHARRARRSRGTPGTSGVVGCAPSAAKKSSAVALPHACCAT